MARSSFANLGELRSKVFGFRPEFIARRTGIDAGRLAQVESGAESPTTYELEILSAAYGIDAESLVEEPIVLSAGDGVSLLQRQDEFNELGDEPRYRIVAAATAARDLKQLRRWAGEADIASAVPQGLVLQPPPVHSRPFERGRHYASLIRQWAHLGADPVASLRDLVRARFDGVSVLYADLGDQGPAGLSFADAVRGPTIVLNIRGKNQNPCVRRVTLAHELCHLLVDHHHHAPLAQVSGYLGDREREIEQVANSFAIRLLCPEGAAREAVARLPAEEAAGHLMERFGLPYAAVRLYLKNLEGSPLPPRPPTSLVGKENLSPWSSGEDPAALREFPLQRVPPERRTDIARYSAQCYSEGRVTRDAFARYLGLTPADDLESVLDWFAMDAPEG